MIDRETAIYLTGLAFMGHPLEVDLPLEVDEDLDWDIDDEEE